MKRVLTLLGVAMATHAGAQSSAPDTASPIFLPSTSSYYNQQGFNLPSQTRPSGQDIVRGSGGISCQSAVGGAGPTLDMGVIGTEDPFGRDSASLYGRVTIPLGKKPKRVDCTRLYEMELQRLQLELEMLRVAQQPQESPVLAVSAPDAEPPEGYSPPPFRLGNLDGASAPRPVKAAAAMAAPATEAGFEPEPAAARFGAAVVSDPTPSRCGNGDIVVLRGDGSRVCGPHLSGHTVQLSAFKTVHEARAAWEAAAEGLDIPDTAVALIRPRHLRSRTLQAVQVARLTEREARRLCADLNGECIIRHEG